MLHSILPFDQIFISILAFVVGMIVMYLICLIVPAKEENKAPEPDIPDTTEEQKSIASTRALDFENKSKVIKAVDSMEYQAYQDKASKWRFIFFFSRYY
jgi:voltage-gated potassium channel Kch